MSIDAYFSAFLAVYLSTVACRKSCSGFEIFIVTTLFEHLKEAGYDADAFANVGDLVLKRWIDAWDSLSFAEQLGYVFVGLNNPVEVSSKTYSEALWNDLLKDIDLDV